MDVFRIVITVFSRKCWAPGGCAATGIAFVAQGPAVDLSVQSALAARITPGSTGPGPVADQLAIVQHKLDTWRTWAIEKVVPR
jgi:hypothetical protein